MITVLLSLKVVSEGNSVKVHVVYRWENTSAWKFPEYKATGYTLPSSFYLISLLYELVTQRSDR